MPGSVANDSSKSTETKREAPLDWHSLSITPPISPRRMKLRKGEDIWGRAALVCDGNGLRDFTQNREKERS